MKSGMLRVIKEIKELKIQGAEPIAVASANLMKHLARNSKKGRYQELIRAKNLILKTRITEPCALNTLNYLLRDIKSYNDSDIRSIVPVRANEVMAHFKEAQIRISKFGAKKILNKSVIFTHCHSSTVIAILKEAKEQKKEFEVHNTETRPSMQGRKTALDLSNFGIKVTHYVDAAARLALKDADIMLIGCDAITSEGKVVNKMGSEMFAEIAERLQIPVYICTNSWKFDAQSVFGYELSIEERSASEIWKNPPKRVKVDNHSFEKLNPNLITGIISEFGIYPPSIFIEIVREKHPWIFDLAI